VSCLLLGRGPLAIGRLVVAPRVRPTVERGPLGALAHVGHLPADEKAEDGKNAYTVTRIAEMLGVSRPTLYRALGGDS
jgi:hypothetical protein